LEAADRLIDSISKRFFILSNHPYLGRARDDDFGEGTRSLATGEYVIVYAVEGTEVFILRVIHGRRDLETVFGG
jgi:toxin ParE1/3/4